MQNSIKMSKVDRTRFYSRFKKFWQKNEIEIGMQMFDESLSIICS